MNTKTLLASAIGLTLIGAVNTAQAGAIATSGIDVRNFIVHRGSLATSPTLAAGSLTGLGYNSNASASATLNGSTVTSGTINQTDSSVGIDTYQTRGVVVPAYTENNFTSHIFSSAFGDPTANFAFGDQLETGAPISGLTGVNGAVTVGAHLYNESTASIDSVGSAGATSNNGLVADWRFTTGFSDFLTFTYDVAAYLESFIDPVNKAPSSAQSGGSIQFLLTDLADPFGTNLLSGTGTSFTWTTGRNSPLGNGLPSVAGTALALGAPNYLSQVVTTTSALVTGRTYNLTANILTSATVNSVPEPGILALMGLGMIGMASMRKRHIG